MEDAPVTSTVSFVCCIESGWLEAQTVRMVESLRRQGGALAKAPVFVVLPRLGAPISRSSRDALDRWEATFLATYDVGRYDWFKFLNKPKAVAIADERASTDILCWLDSDMLVLREPEAVVMADDVDFVASSSDKEMGTSGSGDPYDPLWQELARAMGLRLEDLPWLTPELEPIPVRLYWNSGFFAFRRKTGLGRHYLSVTERLLEARVIGKEAHYSTGINEMSALGFAVIKYGLRYASLPYPYNYPLSGRTPAEWYTEERLAETRILHYHDGLWPETWPIMIERLRKTHPGVLEWLEPLGPMKNPAPLPYRVMTRALSEVRKRRETAYRAACRTV